MGCITEATIYVATVCLGLCSAWHKFYSLLQSGCCNSRKLLLDTVQEADTAHIGLVQCPDELVLANMVTGLKLDLLLMGLPPLAHAATSSRVFYFNFWFQTSEV